MKIIIACDSFKGSLNSFDVALAIERGVLAVFPHCEIHKIAIADGGEGTTDSLMNAMQGSWQQVEVCDPLLRPIKARYGIVNQNKTAIIEMAAASGLTLLAEQERNPMKASTYGTGQLILDAFKRGCRNFMIGIGGSATNDGGTGMLQALGFRFLDAKGTILHQGGEILSQIAEIDASGAHESIQNSQFTIACDVNNPLVGKHGAAYVFAPQKGATSQMVALLDQGLRNYARVISRFNGISMENYPGAGAAGGLGGSFKALLGADLKPGIELILEAVNFDRLLDNCDWVITGEGRIDAQTSAGKAPMGVLAAAMKKHIPVIAIAGQIEHLQETDKLGFAAMFSIQQKVVSLKEAMMPHNTSNNIEATSRQIMRLILEAQKFG